MKTKRGSQLGPPTRRYTEAAGCARRAARATGAGTLLAGTAIAVTTTAASLRPNSSRRSVRSSAAARTSCWWTPIPAATDRIVEGLTAADFQILEDGKPQKIEAFEFVRVEPGLSESERRDPNNQREAWSGRRPIRTIASSSSFSTFRT